MLGHEARFNPVDNRGRMPFHGFLVQNRYKGLFSEHALFVKFGALFV